MLKIRLLSQVEALVSTEPLSNDPTSPELHGFNATVILVNFAALSFTRTHARTRVHTSEGECLHAHAKVEIQIRACENIDTNIGTQTNMWCALAPAFRAPATAWVHGNTNANTCRQRFRFCSYLLDLLSQLFIFHQTIKN